MNAHPPALLHAHQTLVHWAGRIFPESLVLLAARLAIAGIFWRSGRTKVEGWFTLSDSAVALFTEEYQLPWVDPGFGCLAGSLGRACAADSSAPGIGRALCGHRPAHHDLGDPVLGLPGRLAHTSQLDVPAGLDPGPGCRSAVSRRGAVEAIVPLHAMSFCDGCGLASRGLSADDGASPQCKFRLICQTKSIPC